MKFLADVLGTNTLGFFLILAAEGGATFEIERSLTPMGWALVIMLSTSLIFGTAYLISRIFIKTKLK